MVKKIKISEFLATASIKADNHLGGDEEGFTNQIRASELDRL